LAVVLGGAAVAARAPADPPTLPLDLIAALDSPSLKDREDATMKIGQGEPMARLSAVEAALRDPALSPEQRERLHTAGLRLFGGTPRAAMGVTIAPLNGDGPVSVDPSAPGFDAGRVLRAGDVVRVADGLSISAGFDLRCAIVSHDPGDEMTLGIVRSGEPMVVRVKLGRFSDLQQGQPVDEAVLVGAWNRRAARVSPAPEPPLAGDLDPERWAAALERARDSRSQRSEPMVDPSSHEPVRSPLSRPPSATLTVGGQGRDPADREDGVALGPRRMQQVADAQLAERRRNESNLSLIRAQMSRTAERITELERSLAAPDVPAAQRAANADELEQLRIHRVRLVEWADSLSQRLGR